MKREAVIGFRAKTGRAIAVALTADRAFIFRQEIDLTDTRVPETAQPYHVVMDRKWPDALVAAAPFVQAIERVAMKRLETLLRDLAARGLKVRRIGIVGSPDRALERLGNPHIRAHAAEGVLFRHVLEVAAERHGVRSQCFAEEAARGGVPAELLKAIGEEAGSPWRSDEKAAAAAALLVLA